MIELQLKTVLFFVGAMVVIGVGFLGLIFYLVFQRIRNANEPKGQPPAGRPSGVSSVQKGIEAGQRLLDRGIDKVVSKVEKKSAPEVSVNNDVPLVSDFPAVVTFYRNPVNQKLVVLLPGQTKPALAQGLDGHEMAQLTQVNVEFAAWLNPDKKPEPKQEIKPSVISTPTINQEPSGFANAGEWMTKVDKGEEKNMSMASQVNEILQSILVSDHYQGPEVRLLDGEHGDLVVWIGARKYIGLDEVPDEFVVEKIRTAANYWADTNFNR